MTIYFETNLKEIKFSAVCIDGLTIRSMIRFSTRSVWQFNGHQLMRPILGQNFSLNFPYFPSLTAWNLCFSWKPLGTIVSVDFGMNRRFNENEHTFLHNFYSFFKKYSEFWYILLSNSFEFISLVICRENCTISQQLSIWNASFLICFRIVCNKTSALI